MTVQKSSTILKHFNNYTQNRHNRKKVMFYRKWLLNTFKKLTEMNFINGSLKF